MDQGKVFENLNENVKFTKEEEIIRRRLSDEEVARLSSKVEISRIGTRIGSPLGDVQGRDFENIVKKSNTDIIVDLACSRTYKDQIEREGIMPPFWYEKNGLSKVGIHQYIGVDLGQPEFDWREVSRDHLFENKGMRYRMMKQELLQALHSFPDDSMNACMYGVEEENIVRNAHEWALGVLSELKRVVPINGFICTDLGIIGGTLRRMPNDLYKVVNLHKRKNQKRIDPPFTQEEKTLLEGYRVKEDDVFFPEMHSLRDSNYVVDLPSIGFRVYLPLTPWGSYVEWDQSIILINVKKDFKD